MCHMSHVTYHMLYVICCMPLITHQTFHVTCLVSHVTFHVTCLVSHVTYHVTHCMSHVTLCRSNIKHFMSHIICCMSHVTCHTSCVTCHMLMVTSWHHLQCVGRTKRERGHKQTHLGEGGKNRAKTGHWILLPLWPQPLTWGPGPGCVPERAQAAKSGTHWAQTRGSDMWPRNGGQRWPLAIWGLIADR